mgnify:CR=1 FL=1
MQTPTIGRIVIVKGFSSNNSDEQPAVVTRVFAPDYVNLMVMPDAGSPVARTSVRLFENKEQAEQFQALQNQPVLAAFWPARV